MKMRDSRRRREGDPICRSGLIAAPRQRIAEQLAAYRRGASPDDPADLTTRCAGFIKPRHLNALVQVELIILRSHCNSGLYRRCTWRVNLGAPFTTSALEIQVRQILSAQRPVVIEIRLEDIYIAAYEDDRLPISSTRTWSLADPKVTGSFVAGLFG